MAVSSDQSGYGKQEGSLADTQGSEGKLSTTLTRVSCRPAMLLLGILAMGPLSETYQDVLVSVS